MRSFVIASLCSLFALGCGGDGSTDDAGTGRGSAVGGGSATTGGGTGTTGGGTGALNPCDLSTVGAHFIPASGATQDVAAALTAGSWQAPGAGALRLCGGSWTANITRPAGATGELLIESLTGTRAQLTGNVQVIGPVRARNLDLSGRFYAQGGTAAAPVGSLSLEDVSIHTPSTQTMFDGAMVVTANDAGLVADGSLLGVVAGIDFAHVTIEAVKVDNGATPILLDGSLRLDDVTSITAQGGFMSASGSGVVSVTGGQFITRGRGPALLLANDSYTVVDAGFTSDGTSGADPLQALLVLTGAGSSTMHNLTFTMAGQRGGITARQAECTGCTFTTPGGAQAAVTIAPPNGVGGGLNVTDCTFTGDDTERFISSTGNGTHRAVDSTFSNGFAGATGGGAISVPRGQLLLTRCSFTDNHTTGNGGAVLTGEVVTSVNLFNATDSTFTGNSAGGLGGAVWSTNQLQLSGSTFTGNTAVSGGGAVVSRSSSNHVIGTSTFHANDGGVGAAVVYRYSGTNSLQVTNSDFGTGATDNAPNDVQKMNPDESLTTVTRNAAAGATFMCSSVCN